MPGDGSQAVHERFIRAALAEARQAAARGDTAVGALVAIGEQIVAIGSSRVASAGNPLAHAEMEVIAEACARLGRARLRECTLYATMEPCPMCGWAIHLAGIGTVVLGARHRALGRTDLGGYSLDGLMRSTNQSLTIVSGILEAECTSFRRAWQERTGRLV
jgi:tRNA(adenine34) deaminase